MGRSVSVALLANVANFVRGFGTAAGSVKALGGELDKAARAGKLDKVTAQTAALGLGLAGVAAAAVKMRMDFDKSMSAVAAATGANAKQIDQLRQAAIKAGQDTQFSATQAADGITALGKAGVSTADILGGGLKGALDLAAAGQISVAEAAETSASALTQFQLSGNQVPHVADLLAAAAGKAQGSVHDMGFALNQSGLVASQFGLSVEDTTGALAEFASAGLIGSDAGTSFKTMLLAMANPSKQAKSAMDELGISFYDAKGQFIGVSGVAQVLQNRLRSLTQEQRNQALASIFGNDAIRSASVLYTDGAVGVKEWADAVNDSGFAQRNAAKLTDNLSGDLERLKGSLETVAIQAGGGATNGLRVLTKTADGAVGAFSELPGWIQSTITVLSGVGGISLLAAAGFLKARTTAKEFLDELSEMGPKGAAASAGLSKVAGIAGKLGIAGAAAVGLYEGFKLFGDWLDHFTAPTVRDVDKMTSSLKEFGDTGKVTGELAKTFGSDLGKLKTDFQQLADAQKAVSQLSSFPQSVYAGRGAGAAPNAAGLAQAKQQLAQLTEDTSALDKALAQLASNGGAAQAKIAFQQLSAQTGINISQLPQYAAAAGQAAAANTGLAAGFGTAEANAKTMTTSLKDAIDAGEKITDVWNELNGALASSDKATLAANQAISAVADAFKANKRAIDGNTDAALKNRIAVSDAAEAAAKAAQAKYEETGSVGAASDAYNGYISQLKKTLHEAGLNDTQINHLIGQYAKMPESIATTITQPGMDASILKAQDLWTKLQGVDGDWVAKIRTTGYSGVAGDLRHLLAAQQALKDGTTVNEANRELGHFFNSGGPVSGAGGPTEDKIRAWLSNGEHVWTAAEVAKVGGQQAMLQLRAAVRSGKRVEYGDETPGFAKGGAVIMPFPTTASKTKIPTPATLALPGGGGGPGWKWMVAAAHAAFPGLGVISTFRPGARTLTGNRSYHSVGRAVDFSPSQPFAEWVNAKYMRQTKELITPWQSLNIHNGARHHYSPLIENQHSGSNAHDHWAMARGGVIREPVFGVGRSGDTYSFGEGGRPETVVPGVGPFGDGGTTVVKTTTLAPVININGSNLTPQQIASQVNRQLGALVDQQARGI